MIKAIIFDRDGVIIDTEGANVKAAVKSFSEIGIELEEEDKKLILGRNPVDYLVNLHKKYNFNDEDFKPRQKKYYFELIENAKFFEKTILLIRELYKKGYKLAVTTTSGKDSTVKILEKAKILNLFTVIVTAEDCNRRKPFPDPYLITAEKLDVEPFECLVVEDSQVGLTSAKSANMKCVILPTELSKDQDFSNADYVFENPMKILEVLEE